MNEREGKRDCVVGPLSCVSACCHAVRVAYPRRHMEVEREADREEDREIEREDCCWVF